MSRIVKNKPKLITCKICNKELSSYGMPSHIIKTHKMTVDEYEIKYEKFRQEIIRKGIRKIPKHTCQLCKNIYSVIGMGTHLRDTHNMTVTEYESRYNSFICPTRQKYFDNQNENFTCKICNKIMSSSRALSFHIQKIHNIKLLDYVKQYIFNNIPQICACGCGTEVGYKSYPPYKNDYISGHNNAMLNHKHTDKSKEKMSKAAISRIKGSNKSNTMPEKIFKQWLDNNNIQYIHQYETEFGCIDFYIPTENCMIEIDGIYWHPINLDKLSFKLIAGTISDYHKDTNLTLIRLRSDKLDSLSNLNSINQLNSISEYRDYTITFNQIIIEKSYFTFYIQTKGADKLRSYIPLLLKFIRTFQPTFPYPTTTSTLKNIMYNLTTTNYSHILTNNNFKNTCSIIGVDYLKSIFKSYWQSSYNNSLSPIDAWNDDHILSKVIEYRIGLNNSNEIYDFSLHQLIRGLSARRHTISFFKPALAKQIYLELCNINNITSSTPTIFDPCMGFGGRLLGFKSAYPNGIYIGCEPNIDTYNELIQLRQELILLGYSEDSMILYNCAFEEFNINSIQYDLCFTSIPYYTTEIYSNTPKYVDYNDWITKFLLKFNQLTNCYINIPQTIYNEDYHEISHKIISNTSHFNKKQQNKEEFIVKIKKK